MKVKLCDLKALENLTIAAYDIPDNMVLASKAKFTKAAGKNNCFISGAPHRPLTGIWRCCRFLRTAYPVHTPSP